jgi:hypothetical protein
LAEAAGAVVFEGDLEGVLGHWTRIIAG